MNGCSNSGDVSWYPSFHGLEVNNQQQYAFVPDRAMDMGLQSMPSSQMGSSQEGVNSSQALSISEIYEQIHANIQMQKKQQMDQLQLQLLLAKISFTASTGVSSLPLSAAAASAETIKGFIFIKKPTQLTASLEELSP
jgi:hypothetical protein